MKPTICFATICKNEEECILKTLESVWKHIDYWIVCDTGSIDNTVKIVKDFFNQKNIPGELYIDEWVGFDYNKTLLFERCYKKTDYIIHFDADDILSDNFIIGDEFTDFNNYIGYNVNMRRGKYEYKNMLLFNNNYKWKIVGVAHNSYICEGNGKRLTVKSLYDQKYYLLSTDNGSRSKDPEKYRKDAEILVKQFYETLVYDKYNINSRSAFYAAQSFYDCNDYPNAITWYSLYTKLENIWLEEKFEAYLRMSSCLIHMNYNIMDIVKNMSKCITIFEDRAEPYTIMGDYYLMYDRYDMAYFCYMKGAEKNYTSVFNKYSLFIDPESYGLYPLYKAMIMCMKNENNNEFVRLYVKIKRENTNNKIIMDLDAIKHYNNITKLEPKPVWISEFSKYNT